MKRFEYLRVNVVDATTDDCVTAAIIVSESNFSFTFHPLDVDFDKLRQAGLNTPPDGSIRAYMLAMSNIATLGSHSFNDLVASYSGGRGCVQVSRPLPILAESKEDALNQLLAVTGRKLRS